MTIPSIRPTIGRRVWFRPSAAYLASNPTMTQLNPEQAMDAGIVYVHHDHMVNLQVADHVGRQFLVPSVPLLAGVWEPGDDLYFAAEWMPYQKGQAAKSDAEVKIRPEPLASNPHTGAPRDARDMESDPQAVLCTKPGEPLKAAPINLPVRDPGPDSLEREIQARAGVAPRVTPDDIASEIVSEHYFTAADGVQFAKFGEQFVNEDPPSPLALLTFCVLILRNGFTVTGQSACASPENFDAEIGRQIAKENAVEQVWPLLGFRLRDKLHAQVRCKGERCMSTDGFGHSRECIAEAGRDQGWTPTAEELAAAGPSAPPTTEA